MTAQNVSDPQDRTLTSPGVATPPKGEGQVLLVWKAPLRPFQKKTKEYYTTVAALVFLLAVIFFLIQEWLAIGVILSVAFVAYVFSTVPPEDIEHKFTTFGIESAGRRYSWMELYEFWFETQYGSEMVVIHTRLPYPRVIHLLLGPVDKKRLKAILEEYLPYREVPIKTFVDRAANWISKKIPLETPAS